MKVNAAGQDIRGDKNPNWKGGPVQKECGACGKRYTTMRSKAHSKFCSITCVGISQRGITHSRNTMDGRSTISKTDGRRGERNCMAVLSDKQVRELRHRHEVDGISRKQCAQEYDIKMDTAHKILSYRTRHFDIGGKK